MAPARIKHRQAFESLDGPISRAYNVEPRLELGVQALGAVGAFGGANGTPCGDCGAASTRGELNAAHKHAATREGCGDTKGKSDGLMLWLRFLPSLPLLVAVAINSAST